MALVVMTSISLLSISCLLYTSHHKSAGADFAVAIIIKIDSADALARDNGTNGVVVIDFVVKVDLTVEVLTIFGEDDASAIFLGRCV